MKRRGSGWMLAATLAGLVWGGSAWAQYPARSVRLIVPLSTGSASDAFARVVAARLSDAWGQQVVVENIPGANTITGSTVLQRAAPDGYTLAVVASNHLINQSLYAKLPYDTIASFTPVVRLGYTPFVLTTHPSVPAKNLKEFLALAKARPGQLTYGSPGSGSPTHLSMEMLKTMGGVDIIHVPYKAVSQAQTDLIGGQISVMLMVPPVAVPQSQAGRIRALAVSSLKRSSLLPDVPTMDESGLKGFNGFAWIGIYGPAKLPAEIVAKVAADATRVVQSPEVADRIRTLGLEVDVLAMPGFLPFLQQDRDYWAEIVKRSGAKID